MDRQQFAAKNLAAALLSNHWNADSIIRTLEDHALPGTPAPDAKFVLAIVSLAGCGYPPSSEQLGRFLTESDWFNSSISLFTAGITDLSVNLASPKFVSAEHFTDLKIPRLATTGELARWLDISEAELNWFAGWHCDGGERSTSSLDHYTYTFSSKTDGPPRLIEAPKARLKAMQRKILAEILQAVPVHRNAHGFTQGRSCLSSAAIHAGEAVVVAVDLKDYFLRCRLSRVHLLFRSLGYPSAAARLLTSLCSNSVPAQTFRALPNTQRHPWLTRKAYEAPHLPQGAPTSPVLANLTSWRLDQRVSGLARCFGANYSRYADDLAFSGDRDFSRKALNFIEILREIVSEEGFELNGRKTRIMGRRGCQRLTGIVVNDHINVSRKFYDQLKATLYNAGRTGPDAQNLKGLHDFRAHLDGRITWVEQVNLRKGAKLRLLFNKIAW